MAGVQSVDRALRVLEILARDGEAGVTEIAVQLDVHKSTVSRLVDSLEAHDLVEQRESRGRYRLGVGVVRLAGAATARLDLVQESRPLARSLAAEAGETVNIAVLSEGAVLYLDQVAGSSAHQSHNWVGARIPLHATSNGRVLLAGLSDDEALTLLGDELPAYTESTLTDPAAVIERLREVRDAGSALVIGELEQGLTAIAAPVRDVHGDVVASMSVSGPTFRFGPDEASAVRAPLVAHATALSRRLGWHPR